ncbi:biotin/lipoyl-containing protein [Alloprevotella sp. Lung230]|uniref:biotin/lipoyl-containing protein n=1 Tax=Alloprevotella sp. Lung230 TaxID=2766595 RepID=UPI0016565D4B|nr:biotin/lipoyl-containing protein [Alloprevotella sp. Lung230]MBC8626131.1 biotin/lipoyl-binding protein [Alloprevotella sp. Lung230]
MRTYSYNVNGAQYDVTIESIQGQVAKMNVNGVLFDVEILGTPLTEGDLPEAAAAVAPAAAAPAPTPTAAAPAPAAKGAAGAGTPINAPLPGVVTKVLVAAGQAVKKGETVVVLEAMKMENNITAECDGSVTGVCVAAGDSVMEGTTLVTIG